MTDYTKDFEKVKKIQDTLENANRRIGHLVGRIGSEQPAKQQICDIVDNVIADLKDWRKEEK